MATPYLKLSVSAPMPSFAGVLNEGLLDVTAPMPTFDGALCLYHYDIDVTAPMPTFAGASFFGVDFDLSVTAPKPKFSGRFEHYLALAATAPLPTFSANLSFTENLVLAAVASMPTFSGTLLVGAFTPDATATVIVINLRNKRVSTYTNYAFNSMCRLNGVNLAADSTGVYVLSGSTDNGTVIPASVTLGSYDFGDSRHKNIPELNVNYSGGTLEVTTKRDSGDESAARRVSSPTPGKIDTRRVRLPLGSIGRHWQIKVKNLNGSDFEIQEIGIPVDILSRQV